TAPRSGCSARTPPRRRAKPPNPLPQARPSMALERDQRRDLLAERADLVGAAELGQVDDEQAADHLGAGALEQLDRREAGAAGRDQIVDDDDMIAGLDRVGMDLDAVLAVFQIVVLAQHGVRQLAL